MLKSKAALALSEGLFVSLLAMGAPAARAQHELSEGVRAPRIAPASDEGELAIKKFQVPPGLKVDLWAAEPMLANPVAFNFDEKGRAYVCETFRLHAGVDDIREIMDWLDEELASRTVELSRSRLDIVPSEGRRRASLSCSPGLSPFATSRVRNSSLDTTVSVMDFSSSRNLSM